jgi:hypothetical protein
LAVQGLLVATAIVYFAQSNVRYYIFLVVPIILLLAGAIGGPLAAAVTPLGDRLVRLLATPKVDYDRDLDPVREAREGYEALARAGNAEQELLRNFKEELDRLQEYYSINLAHARSSFRLSAFALIAGLLAILLGIGLVYRGRGGITVPAVSTLAGVIVEFISASYFYVYRRSIAQVNYFYQNLTRRQDTMLAISLSDGLADTKRDDARLRLIETLMVRDVLRAPEFRASQKAT